MTQRCQLRRIYIKQTGVVYQVESGSCGSTYICRDSPAQDQGTLKGSFILHNLCCAMRTGHEMEWKGAKVGSLLQVLSEELPRSMEHQTAEEYRQSVKVLYSDRPIGILLSVSPDDGHCKVFETL